MKKLKIYFKNKKVGSMHFLFYVLLILSNVIVPIKATHLEQVSVYQKAILV